MNGIIYKITNKTTKKSYIGQTVRSIGSRWTRHKRDAIKQNSNLALHNAIRKYGPEDFIIEVIETCSSIEEMNTRESFYIEKFNTLSPGGYNLDGGGNNRIPSIETRQKISAALKGTPSPLKGKKQKRSTVLKRSKALRGKPQSEEHRKKNAEKNKKPIICVETGVIYDSTKAAAEDLGIFASNIFNVLTGKYKQAKGYTFRYYK